MKKFRAIACIEVVFEAESESDAADRFGNIDLGALDIEETDKKVDCWSFRDVEDGFQELNDDGTVK